jgi:4-diphosphocytidyl-2-C-methyl-D-erythritol kinase
VLSELAPAKVNLSLLIGPLRGDGRHELRSLMQSITLCDTLEISDGDRDEVHCPGVEGPNLAAAAIAAFREASDWDGPPQRIEIVKRIPVAAGMAGGSADAAAALRLLARRGGLDDPALLHQLASALGSDVPSQLRPGRCLVGGAGEIVERLPDPAPFGILVLPSPARLATAAVYAEADRLGLPRTAVELEALDPAAMVAVNDLQQAAVSLEPAIARALQHAQAAGAEHAFVCGSGPTVIGLFEDPVLADAAAGALTASGVEAVAAKPFATTASA